MAAGPADLGSLPLAPPLRLAPSELAARVADDPLEEPSALFGQPLVLLDADACREAPGAAELAVLRGRLPSLPCVVAAFGPSGPPAPGGEVSPEAAAPGAASVARSLADVLVDGEEELRRLAARVAAAPRAAVALVQVLRLSEGQGPERGLLAESLSYAALQAGPEFRAWLASRPTPPPLPDPAERPGLRAVRRGGRLELRFARPERRNAYSADVRDALAEALALALVDPSVEEVELSGEGPCFSSGGDLAEFGTTPDPVTGHLVRSTRHPARLLLRLSGRTVARVHGACVGAGAELAAFAGRVVAAEDAFFELPELSMGLIPGAGGTVSLPRRIGRWATARLALLGERVDARRALELGLVDRIEARPSWLSDAF